MTSGSARSPKISVNRARSWTLTGEPRYAEMHQQVHDWSFRNFPDHEHGEWFGWLHHQSDRVPESGEESFRRLWQKPHNPNLTGTAQAYRPPGHLLKGGQRDKATGDYEAWRPPE